MSCETWRSEISAYADGELSATHTRTLEEHLRACPQCTREALRLVQLKRLTRAAGQRYAPSAEFRRRIEKKIAPRRSILRITWLAPVAVTATVVVAILLMGFWAQRTQRNQLLSQLTDVHVSTLASTNRTDVVSSDKHTVKPWFQGKIPFTFELPELADSPYKLLGGKVVYLEHSPGAQLLFEVRKHEISVFIFQDSVANGYYALSPTVFSRLNFNLETWSHDGLRYFILSDASPADIHGLAQLLQHP